MNEKTELSDETLLQQAAAMIQRQDLGKWSAEHDRVTLAALAWNRRAASPSSKSTKEADCNCPCCQQGIEAPHEYHLERRPMASGEMRAEFMAWAQDRGCDTDGAWSAWQACWNLRGAALASSSIKEDGPPKLRALRVVVTVDADNSEAAYQALRNAATAVERGAVQGGGVGPGFDFAIGSIKEDGERAARLLTEQETQDAFADVPWPGESNPPHWMERMLAVQRKLLQVNGLSSPPSPLGDTPDQQEKNHA